MNLPRARMCVLDCVQFSVHSYMYVYQRARTEHIVYPSMAPLCSFLASHHVMVKKQDLGPTKCHVDSKIWSCDLTTSPDSVYLYRTSSDIAWSVTCTIKPFHHYLASRSCPTFPVFWPSARQRLGDIVGYAKAPSTCCSLSLLSQGHSFFWRTCVAFLH